VQLEALDLQREMVPEIQEQLEYLLVVVVAVVELVSLAPHLLDPVVRVALALFFRVVEVVVVEQAVSLEQAELVY
jgi:hypothetical protein